MTGISYSKGHYEDGNNYQNNIGDVYLYYKGQANDENIRKLVMLEMNERFTSMKEKLIKAVDEL